MPELPEVEIMTRNLAAWSEGRQVVSVAVTDPRLDMGGLVAWARRCGAARQRVIKVSRRAKFTVMEVGDRAVTDVVLIHYRMTGRVVRESPGVRKGQRLVLTLAPAPGLPHHVIYDDPRRLGTVEILTPQAFEDWRRPSKRMGPEPWPVERGVDFWKARLSSARGAIKPALMDQGRVAGLGNIAASEILWRAQIHPWSVPQTLSDSDWKRLSEAVPAFIEDTIEREGGDEIAYVNSRGGSQRGVPSPFHVYRCEGGSCPRCSEPICAARQAGRSTFWCRSCQPTP